MNKVKKIKKFIQNDEFINLIKPYIKGVDCFLVGGFLRDLATGEISHDRDLIVKSDVAEKLAKTIADNTNSHFVPLDEENKIYRVVMPDKTNYFDISAMLEDNFDKDIHRRDLTINSLAYDLNNDEIVDNVGAISDFENKILRTADLKNFTDDSLRMLRVYRFAAKYNFDIDETLENFIKNNLDLIEKPAKERVNTEIMKLFEGKYSDIALLKMDDVGLLDKIFPVMREVKTIPPNTHHHLDLQHHLIETVRQVQRNYENLPKERQKILDDMEFGNYSRRAFLKFAAFMHDIGKPDTWTIDEETGRHRFIMHDEVGSQKIVPIMRDLKFSKKQIAYVQKMIKYHIYPSSLVWQEVVGSKAHLKFYRKMYPYFEDVIILAMSDRLSAMGEAITADMIVQNLSNLSILLDECFEFGSAVASPKPFLTGNEVMEISGLKQSKALGDIVKALYAEQIEGNISSREEAIDFVKKKT